MPFPFLFTWTKSWDPMFFPYFLALLTENGSFLRSLFFFFFKIPIHIFSVSYLFLIYWFLLSSPLSLGCPFLFTYVQHQPAPFLHHFFYFSCNLLSLSYKFCLVVSCYTRIKVTAGILCCFLCASLVHSEHYKNYNQNGALGIKLWWKIN